MTKREMIQVFSLPRVCDLKKGIVCSFTASSAKSTEKEGRCGLIWIWVWSLVAASAMYFLFKERKAGGRFPESENFWTQDFLRVGDGEREYSEEQESITEQLSRKICTQVC